MLAQLFVVTLLLAPSPSPARSGEAPEATSLEQAIPAGASQALSLGRIEGNIEASVDLLARLFGSSAARAFLDRAPLPRLALRTSDAGRELGVDPAKGIGLFRLPGFPGTIGVVGVSDGARAKAALSTQLQASAVRTVRPDHSLHFALRGGATFAAFVSQGYLYLVMGDAPSRGRTLGPTSLSVEDVVSQAAGWPGHGLDGDHRLQALAARVKQHDVRLYLAAPLSSESDVEGLLATATLRGDTLALDGFVSVRGATWPAAPAVAADPVSPGDGEFAHACVRAPLRRVAELLLGPPTSLRRRAFAARSVARGVDLEPALAALEAPFTARAVAAPTPDRLPRFGLQLEARLAAPQVARLMVPVALELLGWPWQQIGEEANFVTTVLGQPVSLRSGRTLTVIAGNYPKRSGDFCAATASGHVQLAVDLTAVRALLEPLGSAAPEEDPLAVALGVDDLFPFDRALLDLVPEAGGLRITGSLTLQQPEQLTRRP